MLSMQGRVGEDSIGFLLSDMNIAQMLLLKSWVLVPDKLLSVELSSWGKIITDISILLQQSSTDLSLLALFLLDNLNIDSIL